MFNDISRYLVDNMERYVVKIFECRHLSLLVYGGMKSQGFDCI